jgi:hypothetical protein
MSGKSKREKIFNAYSSNLNDYLIAIKQPMIHPQTGLAIDVTGKLYFCPLCYMYFLFHQLNECGNDNFLTLEHNPPKKMGGKATILTCKKCNNTNGERNDKLVRNLLLIEAFLLEKDSSLFNVKFNVDSSPIKGSIQKKGTAVYFKPDPKSNPFAYQKVQNKIGQHETFNFDYSLDVPEWNEYSLGMLKIAYLKAFELFGYYFADMGNGANIRDVLQKKGKYPAPNNGVIDLNVDDKFLGIHIVREPKELCAMIITQKIIIEEKAKSIQKNIPVILPGPSEKSWELLKNYHSVLGGELKIRTEKISLKKIPLLRAEYYYELFNY